MKTVHLILDKAVVGQLDLNADAIQTEEDYRCNPPRMISFKQAREVACRVAEGGTWGYIERYRWELQSETA
jgi:hypothetical protein